MWRQPSLQSDASFVDERYTAITQGYVTPEACQVTRSLNNRVSLGYGRQLQPSWNNGELTAQMQIFRHGLVQGVEVTL
ncbi:hypothetical protein TNCV_96231 [Trichonephila clavipes]|nr:hypothetical protein TNCV_96231 [Trichonephila clavipes]